MNETTGLRVGARSVVEQCLDAAGDGPQAQVDAGDLLDVAALLGVESQPLRLALRRLVASGEVEQTGRGRAATLRRAGPALARAALDQEYWAFAARQDAGEEPWDGTWHLLAFTVPESRRADRDALRTVLAHLGAATLTPGLYLSPHDLAPALAAEIPRSDLDADLTLARADDVRHGGRPVVERIDDLWPLAALRTGYTALDAAVDAWAPRAVADDPVQRLAARIAVGAAVDLAVGPDPLLPPELLPADWPGAQVRARVRAVWGG